MAAKQLTSENLQISTLLDESRIALAAGNLDMAAEKVQTALTLSANHPESQIVLMQVEKASEHRTRGMESEY
ncbi:MAG: hypothetical protein KAH99_02665 [Verrucomicrobia bacterium]|nr:hypothetical protein [Verrucomicrobiota bacterium]